MEANSVLDESIKAETRYRIELTAKKEAAEKSSQTRALWEQELRLLETRRTKCNIARIVVVCLCALFCGILFADSIPNITDPIAAMTFILRAVIAILWCSFLPFGFCPIIDFINGHDFLIKVILVVSVCLFLLGLPLLAIRAILLILLLFVPFLIFALCAGPVYFFYLKFKIKKAKSNTELARQNEQAAYAAYQAF